MSESKKAKELLKKFKKTSTMPDKASIFSEDPWLNREYAPTPIYVLNLALSGKFDGGISRGHIVLAGESGTFKTVLGLLMMKSYLEKYDDGVGFLYDSEHSFTEEYLKAFGIDTDRVFITHFENLDQLKKDAVKQLDEIEKGDKVFFLVDSIGNSASRKEMDDAKAEKDVQDMTRAKVNKSIFRMITPMVNDRDIPFVTINHVYETMDFISKTVISGGRGILYSSNMAFVISKRKMKNTGEFESGKDFVIKIYKSRFVEENQSFPLSIPSKGAVNRYSGLFDMALECGYIHKAGHKYYINGVQTEDEGDNRKKIEYDSTFWNLMFEKTDFKETIENVIKVGSDQTSIFTDETIKEEKEIIEKENVNE